MIIEMVRGSSSRHGGPARAVPAPGGYRSTRSLRLRPLLGAVLLFPFCQAFVRRDVEGVRSWLWGGPFPAPGATRWPGVCRAGERVCSAQVRDPYASLVRLVGVEPPPLRRACLG